jgi:hypothetical protein
MSFDSTEREEAAAVIHELAEELSEARMDAKALAKLCRELRAAYLLHSDHIVELPAEEHALLERWEK